MSTGPSTAQGGYEGRGQPMAMGDRSVAASATLGAAVEAGHLGRGASFVDENELVGIETRCKLAPGFAGSRDIGPILLGRMHAFF